MDDKRLARGRRWFEYHCYEGEDSSDAELWHHTHQQVTVLNKIANIDEADVGRMYRVRFNDGLEYDVCDDELVNSPKDFYRPDYKAIPKELLEETTYPKPLHTYESQDLPDILTYASTGIPKPEH